MINREICATCPLRTDAKLGWLRGECAKLVLGKDYVAPGCVNGGPYPKETIKIEVTHVSKPGLLVGSETITNQQCGTEKKDALVVTTLWDGCNVGQQIDGRPQAY